ncbi:hypothetical protein [Vibrio agarivorans]|uniref:hypothetical protein n=1 Tax=Vibrio agarivorans TaxID=153622 RepID=UPI0025B3779C|nr:hypothetical protein [Vibrio agarivorans]MDN3661181.1 hypothetical protein [Vibrio agarivorans]
MFNVLVFLLIATIGGLTIVRILNQWKQMDDPKLYKNPFRFFTEPQFRQLRVLLGTLLLVWLIFYGMLSYLSSNG